VSKVKVSQVKESKSRVLKLSRKNEISWLKSSKSKLEKDDFVGIGREDRSKSLARVEHSVASTVGLDDR
jgi:hypothetical protein